MKRGVGPAPARPALPLGTTPDFTISPPDGSGYIDAGELKQIFRDLHWPADKKSIRAMLHKLDGDDNGSVSFEEFCRWQAVAFSVRVLSPRYGNTPWSRSAHEPQLTPNPCWSSTAPTQIELVAKKLQSELSVRESADCEEDDCTCCSGRGVAERANHNEPQFANAPTGSGLEPIKEENE